MLNKEKYRDKIFEIAVNHDTCGVKMEKCVHVEK